MTSNSATMKLVLFILSNFQFCTSDLYKQIYLNSNLWTSRVKIDWDYADTNVECGAYCHAEEVFSNFLQNVLKIESLFFIFY